MMKYLFFLFIILIVSGCGPSQKTMDAREDALLNKWLNHSKSELVRSWGQPDSVTSDKKGGQILIYKEGVDFKSVMNEKYTGTQYSFRKEMFINPDSLIYNWKTWRRKQ